MVVRAGVDLAFRKDSSALVIGAAEGAHIRILSAHEWRPTLAEPLRPSKVLNEITLLCVSAGVETVCGDKHERDTAQEYVSAAGLGWLDTHHSNEEPYMWLRLLLRERRITLPNDERLRDQLIATRAQASDAGRLKITHVRNEGHGDIVSALVACVWSLKSDVSQGDARAIGDANERSFHAGVSTVDEDEGWEQQVGSDVYIPPGGRRWGRM